VARPVPQLDLEPDEARKAAFAAGLRMLAGREMSTARLCERLRRRGLPDDAIGDAVARLTRAGALDDARAARAAARTLGAVKLRGRHRVIRELERLGFAPALAALTVADVLADTDEQAAMAKVVAARMRGRSRIADPAAYRRLFGALLRRGFAASAIRDALRPYWGRGTAPVDAPDE
jgi:SOS response regulatory protein OraA/RecX